MDADLYRICLSDGASFSASTVGAHVPANLDTQLFLFDAQGYGIYANDDCVRRASRLHAAGAPPVLAAHGRRVLPRGQPVQPRPPELAGRDLPGQLQRGCLSRTASSSRRLRRARETLTGWDGRAPGGRGTYRITLTGTAPACRPTRRRRRSTSAARSTARTWRRAPRSSWTSRAATRAARASPRAWARRADGETLDTSKLGAVSVTVTARDNAGNQTVVTHTVTVVDDTDPEVTLTTPGRRRRLRARRARGRRLLVRRRGERLGPRQSCVGDVPDGADVDTSTLGEHSFTVEATDQAGNTGSTVASLHRGRRDGAADRSRRRRRARSTASASSVAADYSCADEAGGSGLATCTGTVATARRSTPRASARRASR